MLKQETQTLWKLSAVMIGVSMPLLLLGPAPTIILLALGLTAGLMATHGTSLRSTLDFIKNSPVVPLLLAVLGALFLSAMFSIDVPYSMSKLGDLLGMGLIGAAFYVALREMPPRYVGLTYDSFSSSIIAVAGVCLLDLAWNEPRLSNLLHGEGSDSFSRLHHMSSVFAVLIPFLMAWLIRKAREASILAKWFGIPVALAVWIVLFLCGGAAGWIAALISGAVFITMAVKYHDVKVTFGRAVAGVLAFLSGPAVFVAQEGWSNTLDYIGFGDPSKAFYNSFLGSWVQALELIQDRPFTGFGLNAFRQIPEVMSEGLYTHPHNIVLQLMVETGVIGTVVSLVMIGAVLRYFYTAARSNLYGLAGFCSILAFFIAALMFASIFQSWWLTLLLFSGLFAARVGYAYGNQK